CRAMGGKNRGGHGRGDQTGCRIPLPAGTLRYRAVIAVGENRGGAMTSFFRFLFLCVLVVLLPVSARADMADVKAFASKEQGLRIWMLEDHYLPIVEVKLTFSRA